MKFCLLLIRHRPTANVLRCLAGQGGGVCDDNLEVSMGPATLACEEKAKTALEESVGLALLGPHVSQLKRGLWYNIPFWGYPPNPALWITPCHHASVRLDGSKGTKPLARI